VEAIKTTIENDRDPENVNYGLNGPINDKNTNLLFQTLFSKMDNFSKINIHDDGDECDECEVDSINEIDNNNSNLTIEDGIIEDGIIEDGTGLIEIDETDKETIDITNENEVGPIDIDIDKIDKGNIDLGNIEIDAQNLSVTPCNRRRTR
jgi:hypothetical protein